jgi:hypothetical protein
VSGACVSLCDPIPDPGCLVAAKAQLEVNEKKAGKEKLKLQWTKVGAPTTRAGYGDPVTGDAGTALCIYDDGGTLIADYAIDKGSQACGTKPCWKNTGKQGLKFQDKPGSAEGIVKLIFGGGAAGKGKASVQGKNDFKKGYLSLATGVAAALANQTAPTIQLVTSTGLCLGATMNKVGMDDGQQYKAQKK